MKVGVLLARQPDDLGEWLAVGAAFDAAGADALWVDVAPESGLDPLVLTVALVAVTHRSLVVTTLPPEGAPTRALATIARLSHGRLRIAADGAQLSGPDDAGPGAGVFRRLPGDPEVFEHTHGQDEPERWVSTSAPENRAAWRAAVQDATEHGTRGLLVPADPRLLDLLRNPDDPGERHDLQLAHG
jgi:hypothetical protein